MGAFDTVLGALHVPSRRCQARVQVLEDQLLLMPRHPFKKPSRVAFNRVENFGLHKDWCANLTVLALMVTECVNIARAGWMVGWRVLPIQGLGRDNVGAATKGNPVITHLGRVSPGPLH
jgi:hypothetical protein